MFRIGSILLLLVALFIILPAPFLYGWRSGLDGSWKMALHVAWEKQFIYGSDFVFTYGPLGFLSTRLGTLREWYLISDLIVYLIYSTTLILIWIRLKSLLAKLAVIAALLALNPPVGHQEISLGFFFCAAFFVLRYGFSGGIQWLSLAGALSAISFYHKLNAGLISGFLFLLTILYLSIHRRSVFPAFFSYIVVMFLGAILLPVDFFSYLENGLEIAKGYTEAMAIYPEGDRLHLFYSALIFFLIYIVVGLSNLKLILKDRRQILLWIWISALFFLVFKQGFVRADNHTLTFVQWIAPVSGLLLFYLPKSSGALAIFVLSLMISFKHERLGIDYWQIRFNDKLKYLSEVKEVRGLPEPEVILPDKIISRIGEDKVDLMTHHVEAVSKLNYLPRPVFQSYAAYTPKLDQLNAYNLNSDFIVFKLETIDGRYPWFDESRTKLRLYELYEPILTEEDWILLKRREKPKSCNEKTLSTVVARPRKKVPVPESKGLVYADIEIKYTFLGGLQKLFFQTPIPQIDFHLKDGAAMSFAAIRPIISDHVLVSRFLDSNSDAENFFRGDFEQLRKVDSIRFFLHDSPAFKKEVKYTFKEVLCLEQ